MEPTVITAIVSAITGVVASLLTFLGVRSNTKKDIFMTDRQQLSQEQQDFRKEMREELTYWRSKYDSLENKVDELVKTNVKLQSEVDIWKERYETLSKEYARISEENAHLVKRVNELEGELRRRRKTDAKE